MIKYDQTRSHWDKIFFLNFVYIILVIFLILLIFVYILGKKIDAALHLLWDHGRLSISWLNTIRGQFIFDRGQFQTEVQDSRLPWSKYICISRVFGPSGSKKGRLKGGHMEVIEGPMRRSFHRYCLILFFFLGNLYFLTNFNF